MLQRDAFLRRFCTRQWGGRGYLYRLHSYRRDNKVIVFSIEEQLSNVHDMLSLSMLNVRETLNLYRLRYLFAFEHIQLFKYINYKKLLVHF